MFGTATVAGIWLVGVLVDRHPRATLLSALGLAGGRPAVVVAAVAGWGVAFGGAPTLLQTALVDASGPRNADVATSLQATVYNAGIAAGSLTGGIVLESAGAGLLPFAALPTAAGALAVVAVARRAFPGRRPTG
ncbi:hypothetical protein ACFYT4_14545 [Streptomyces sp. NPDC004609]|uniref:hypothetical protein n=1 Tax=Streptomyces sp. NPDC004609 TaxID=3364704 RepID=UPI003689C3B4